MTRADRSELQHLREFKRHALAVFEKYLNTPESRALRQLAFEIERERLLLSGQPQVRQPAGSVGADLRMNRNPATRWPCVS